ncbi:MAG: ABC transporter ATP-binding protein/permease [Saprospiraceae bacterium]|nr:ABC transporter ATP-binding protein/permease [Saprospiraceae bacterium]
MRALRHLDKYFVKYKWLLLLGTIFVALSNYFRVLQPQAIRQALDLVYENIRMYKLYDGFEAQASMYSSIGKSLLYFALLVLLLALLMGLFMYFMRQTIIVMSRLIEYDLRKEIFVQYEKLDLAFYKKNMTGDLMARITEDVSKVRMYLGPALLYGINLATLFVMVIYAMISVSPELSLYCLLPLPFLSLSIYFVSSIIHSKSEVIQRQLARLNSISQEVYNGIRVVKSYTHEKHIGDYFTEECDDYKDKSMKLASVNALFFPVMLLIIGASTILTIYFGGLQVYKGNITPGNIAEFVIYVNMLTWPVTSIGWIASIIQQAEASQERINSFLHLEPEISNPTNQRRPIQGAIEFAGVDFVYPDTGIQALKNVSFTLRKGEKLAIVGRTGSGKSTIADLLVRMYDTTNGVIRIDDVDIKHHNLEQIREKIGYVPQDVFLFSDTVEDNIRFGQGDSNGKDPKFFAKKAAVYDDIMELPDKFETMVGERGVTLSGGQKQRISIARAFIKEPEIVILDDCLSAVDTTTENQILSYLNDALTDKTTIVITHRIYGMLQFDKIIVLEQGEIVEEGTHETLMNRNGFYAKMYDRQRVMEDENKIL